jgi:hypothetical protein
VEYDYCYNQLKIVRDSISLLDSINCQQDTIILNKNKEIILLENNVTQIKKIAAEHEERGNFYKSEVDKQKRLKNIAIGGGILSVILSILFL